jgi:DUF438 domain-containing protein
MEKEEQELIDKFVENSVSMQNLLADAIVSINRLTKEMSEMVELFKEAAKTVEENKDSEILAKLNSMAEDNKTIAKSLAMTLDKTKQMPKPLPEYKF